jgi:hypothetical protein
MLRARLRLLSRDAVMAAAPGTCSLASSTCLPAASSCSAAISTDRKMSANAQTMFSHKNVRQYH